MKERVLGYLRLLSALPEVETARICADGADASGRFEVELRTGTGVARFQARLYRSHLKTDPGSKTGFPAGLLAGGLF